MLRYVDVCPLERQHLSHKTVDPKLMDKEFDADAADRPGQASRKLY